MLSFPTHTLAIVSPHPAPILGSLHTEAAVVGVVCTVFLILMVVSGVRQILKDRED